MAISPAQKKTAEDIVRRLTKDAKFRERVRLNLDRVLMDEYGLKGQTEEIRKLLPAEVFAKELGEKELKSIAGGFSVGSMISGAWHDVENAGKDVIDGVEDAGKAVYNAGKDVVVGAYDVGKDVVEGGMTVGKDLFQGKIGDAAKALVNVPVAAGKDAVKGVVGGAEALGDGVVNVAGDAAKFAVDSSGIGVLGGALGITPKIDGLIDGAASGLNKSVNALGTLTQDVADTSIDFTNLPTTALAQSFDDVTHGQWGKALTDPVTVPLSTMGADGKKIFSDAANPNTIMGLLAVGGLVAAPFTGGASEAAALGADAALEGSVAAADAAGTAAVDAAGTAATDGASSLASRAAAAVRGAATSVSDTVSGAARGAASAARSAATSVADSASNVLNTARNAVGLGSKAATAGEDGIEMTSMGEEELEGMSEERAAETGNFQKKDDALTSKMKAAQQEIDTLKAANPDDSKIADAVSNLRELSSARAQARLAMLESSAPTEATTTVQGGAQANVANATEAAAQPGRLSQIKDAMLSKKGLLIGGGAATAGAGALILPKILSSAKGAEATPETSDSAKAATTAGAAQPAGAPSQIMNGLNSLQATLSDPKLAQLAQAVDQQAGTQNTAQNMSQLAQNTAAVLQNPTSDNVEQLSTQLASVFQSLQSIQGSASQQMQNILSQLYAALNPPST